MRKKRKKRMIVCPYCGHKFKEGRLSCPECGSDYETGWKTLEEIEYYSVDIPEPYDTEDSEQEHQFNFVQFIRKFIIFLVIIWLIIFFILLF